MWLQLLYYFQFYIKYNVVGSVLNEYIFLNVMLRALPSASKNGIISI
jgi:hypothetical protein